jgi:hypothetical protein
VAELSELSGRPRPPGPLLLGEVDGEVWAALPLAGGDPLADPFRPTTELRALLALRADQLRRLEPEPGREERAQVLRLPRGHDLTAGPPPGPRLS